MFNYQDGIHIIHSKACVDICNTRITLPNISSHEDVILLSDSQIVRHWIKTPSGESRESY